MPDSNSPPNVPTHNAVVCGRFTSAGDVEISGTRRGLRQLAALLKTRHALDVQTERGAGAEAAAPHEAFLEQIRIRPEGDLVELALQGAALHVSGDVANLEVLAENIDWLSSRDAESGTVAPHLHVDYW